MISGYHYLEVFQHLGNDTWKSLQKTSMNKLNEIMVKFNKISKYCYPEVLQPRGNDTRRLYGLRVSLHGAFETSG